MCIEKRPIDLAIDHYKDVDGSFESMFYLYSRNGYVIAKRDLFVMARPVLAWIANVNGVPHQMGWGPQDIVDPAVNPEPGTLAPCLHIEYLAGSIKAALPYMPDGIDFLSYQRAKRGDYRVHITPIEPFLNHGISRRTTTPRDSGTSPRPVDSSSSEC